ncbi:MAG: 16S rRNA (cytidine(1402)-2'-O)-methyltransferase [Melioribacteraceae bacterium]
MTAANRLYIVSTPIGNFEDITLRAINILKDADLIICEEFKEARRLLSHLRIEKELYSINEHNEEESSRDIMKLIKEGRSAVLISDCGTPLFSDPGKILVRMCIEAGIDVVPVPGANSLLPALVGSGFNLDSFYYAGWLSPKIEIRKKELSRLKNIHELLVIMETPYRLKAVLTDISKIFGPKTEIVVAYELTLPTEKFFRGTAVDILKRAESQKLKGEFVLLVNNRK